MNNLHLKTFIGVVEAGSFNKAAETMFITSTAVIKQINLLENDLGVRLFDRTHRGLILTKAGESLYKDAKYIVAYCQEAEERARNAIQEDSSVIRIGTSPIMPAQMLMDLWPKIHEQCADLTFRLVPFENTQENAREILKNLGQNIDVVVGFVDETLMDIRQCAGFEIARDPLCCAVSIYDPLAAKERLTMQDLSGRNLMIIKRGWSSHVDAARDDLERYPIHLIDFDLYHVGVFNTCEQNRDVLLVIKSWNMVHPLMKVIPVEWDHEMPIGILHSPQPTEPVRRFIQALKAVL